MGVIARQIAEAGRRGLLVLLESRADAYPGGLEAAVRRAAEALA